MSRKKLMSRYFTSALLVYILHATNNVVREMENLDQRSDNLISKMLRWDFFQCSDLK